MKRQVKLQIVPCTLTAWKRDLAAEAAKADLGRNAEIIHTGKAYYIPPKTDQEIEDLIGKVSKTAMEKAQVDLRTHDVKEMQAVKKKDGAMIAMIIESMSVDCLSRCRGIPGWQHAVDTQNLQAVYDAVMSLFKVEAMAARAYYLVERASSFTRLCNEIVRAHV